MSARRGIAARYIKANSSRKGSRPSKAVGDPRQVVRDLDARYFGSRVEERSLVPLGEARLEPHQFGRMGPPLTVRNRGQT
jgi:hypothetical protein